jgi:5-methyltetrahydropteroyltriglutamate--homocysteine methyltransferase
VADHIRLALKHIPAERLVLSSDCGMGREGMARRHALYKMVSLAQGTNIVRQELGINQAECIAADTNLTLLDVKRTPPAAAAPATKAAAKPAPTKSTAKKSKKK